MNENLYNNEDTQLEEYSNITQILSTSSMTKYNTGSIEMTHLTNYINQIKDQTASKYKNKYTLTEEELNTYQPGDFVSIDNSELRDSRFTERVDRLNTEQKKAYDLAGNAFRDNQQIIMFLTGEGGTGKSEVIHCITDLAYGYFGKSEGSFGVVLKTAPTGCAAYNINGSTWHSALGKTGMKRITSSNVVNDKQRAALQKRAKGLRVFILDEISLTSLEDLYEIDFRLRSAMNNLTKPFGGLHVILAGDFYQMRCMGGLPIVEVNIPDSKLEAQLARRIFTEFLTNFVELKVNCRAMANNGQLSSLADINRNIRIGNVGPLILSKINVRLAATTEEAMCKADPNAMWITSTHKSVQRINTAFLQNQIKNGATVRRIVANHIPTLINVPDPDENIRDELYKIVGDIRGARNTTMVTHLDLVEGTRVRLTRNLSVHNGLYNGSMGTILGFIYQGPGPQSNDELMPKNFSILRPDQREIPIILVQMDGNDNDDTFPSCSNRIRRLIPFSSFNGPPVRNTNYQRVQIPLLAAHARTGHSVQGMTAHHGVVVDTGSQFFAGDYVAISRATDIEKVIILKGVTSANFTSHSDYRLLVANEYKRLRIKFPNNN